MVAINAGERCVHSHEHDTAAIECAEHAHDHDSCSHEPCNHVCVMSPAPQAVHSPAFKCLDCATLTAAVRHFSFDEPLINVRTILETGISCGSCPYINPILRC